MTAAPRCMYCGRFISLEEIDNGGADAEWTQDTEFTAESVDWYHKSCLPESEEAVREDV